MRKGFWFIGLLMTLFFLLAGVSLMLSTILVDKIPAPNREYLALVFFAYSGFRTFRLYKQYPYVFTNENQE